MAKPLVGVKGVWYRVSECWADKTKIVNCKVCEIESWILIEKYWNWSNSEIIE